MAVEHTLAGVPPVQAGASFDTWLVRALVALSFCFSLLPPGFDFSPPDPQVSYAEGSLALQLEFGSIFLAGAWLAFRHAGWTFLKLRGTNPFLLALLAYCAASVLWSPYPIVTLKKLVQLGGFLMVGIAIAPPIGGPRQMLRVLVGTLTALLVVCMVVALVNPVLGVDYELGGAWRGVMSQKNTMGAVAGLCVLLWIREWMTGEWLPRTVCSAALLFCALMLVMAKSSTAMLVTAIGVGAYLTLRRRYVTMHRPWWVLGLSVAALVVLAVHLFYTFAGRLPTWDDIAGSIGALFNKKADLTGRTDIWELVMLEVSRHPVLGLGYGAFWLGEGSRSQYVIDALYWVPLQSHNGYLDLLNELGMVGLALAICSFGWYAAKLGRLLAIDREEGAMYCALFAVLLVSNVTESEVYRGVLFHNILFLYASSIVAARVSLHAAAVRSGVRTA